MSLDKSTKALLTEMAENVPKVKQQGYNEGYEAGKQKEWSDFWDVFQNYGKRTNYWYGFHSSDYAGCYPWNKDTFKPKYDLIPTNANKMLYRVSGISDLDEHCQKLGVKIDFSKSTSLTLAFCYGSWKIFHTLDCSNATDISSMCNYCSSLETIEKLIVSEKLTTAGTCFNYCTNFKNITVEGVIPVSISFSHSPLTRESALSIINHLKDISGTGTTRTVTFSSTTKALLPDEDKAIATQKGWTIA